MNSKTDWAAVAFWLAVAAITCTAIIANAIVKGC